MPVDVVLDTSLGDSGKGKLVDVLADHADAVVRFHGGNNAGHTVIADGETYKLHLLPCGMIRGLPSYIGNGVVVDPNQLITELDGLIKLGLDTTRLRVAGNAHIITSYHVWLDGREEEGRSDKDSIGTTRRGIGPAYADKIARRGVRFQDLMHRDRLLDKFSKALAHHSPHLSGFDRTADELADEYAALGERLREYLCHDVQGELWRLHSEGKTIIAEGAQGTLLDIDFGVYPFVTSSNCTIGAVMTGSGLPPSSLRRIWGVVKAFPTRVDTVGPFPSRMREDEQDVHDLIIERGREFGTTTGRRRRAGWPDALALGYANRINDVTDILIAKLDVLHDIETLKICVGYRDPRDGEEYDFYPFGSGLLSLAEPIYEELPGWDGEISDAREWEELPPEAQAFCERLVELTTRERPEARLSAVGVGPDREQIIFLP